MMDKKRCTAIVLAAGRGSRMESDVAKQYMLLRDRPLIWYALHAIEVSSVIDDCILVTSAEDISYVKKDIVTKYGFYKVTTVVAGEKSGMIPCITDFWLPGAARRRAVGRIGVLSVMTAIFLFRMARDPF